MAGKLYDARTATASLEAPLTDRFNLDWHPAAPPGVPLLRRPSGVRDRHAPVPGVNAQSVNEPSNPNVPAFQASILSVLLTHALTRVAISCRRFTPLLPAYAVEAHATPTTCRPALKRRFKSSPAPQRGLLMADTSRAEGALQESCGRT